MSSDISIIIGTRPQIIKLATLVRAFDSRDLSYSIIHTGQHYDFEMDQMLFDELNLPEPEVHLGARAGNGIEQTATIMMRLQGKLDKRSVALIPGDTNSALAGGLTAARMPMRVGHIEAGVRSYKVDMPEETNRVVLDHICHLLFPPTRVGFNNLVNEGIDKNRIFQTGDVMADNIFALGNRIDESILPTDIKTDIPFAYTTIHRAENLASAENLKTIVRTMTSFHERHGLELVFPLHPHTEKRLRELNVLNELMNEETIHVVKPVNYLTSLRLTKEAEIVVTDSGGIQKEAFILGTPCVTVRDSTEWIETVETGWSNVAGADADRINRAVSEFLNNKPKQVDAMSYYGNGRASESIAQILEGMICR